MGEHTRKHACIFLYDSTTHMPLIVKLPGQMYSTKVVAQQVRSTDILPTVLDVVGIASPIVERALSHVFGGSVYPYVHPHTWEPFRSWPQAVAATQTIYLGTR